METRILLILTSLNLLDYLDRYLVAGGILGFAGGAMLYVISDEIIPETHRKGHETLATGSLMIGVALMLGSVGCPKKQVIEPVVKDICP